MSFIFIYVLGFVCFTHQLKFILLQNLATDTKSLQLYCYYNIILPSHIGDKIIFEFIVRIFNIVIVLNCYEGRPNKNFPVQGVMKGKVESPFHLKI